MVGSTSLQVCVRCFPDVQACGWHVFGVKAIHEASEQGRPTAICDMWHRNPHTCARVVVGQVDCGCFRRAEMELHDHGCAVDGLHN